MRIRQIILARRLAEDAARRLSTAEQDHREGFRTYAHNQAVDIRALLRRAIKALR